MFFIPTEEPCETEGPRNSPKKGGVIIKKRVLKSGTGAMIPLAPPKPGAAQPKPGLPPPKPKSIVPPMPPLRDTPAQAPPTTPSDAAYINVYNNVMEQLDTLKEELDNLEGHIHDNKGAVSNTDEKGMDNYLVHLRTVGIETEFHLAKNDFPSTEMARLDSKYKDLKKVTAKLYNTIYEPPKNKTQCGLCDAYVFTEYCEVCDRPTGKTALVDVIKGLEDAVSEEEVMEELEPVEKEGAVQLKKGYEKITDIKDACLLFDGKEVKKDERPTEGFKYTPRGVVDAPADGSFYWEIYMKKPDGSFNPVPTVLKGKAEALPDDKGTLVTAEGTFSLNKDEVPIANIVYMEK